MSLFLLLFLLLLLPFSSSSSDVFFSTSPCPFFPSLPSHSPPCSASSLPSFPICYFIHIYIFFSFTLCISFHHKFNLFPSFHLLSFLPRLRRTWEVTQENQAMGQRRAWPFLACQNPSAQHPQEIYKLKLTFKRWKSAESAPRSFCGDGREIKRGVYPANSGMRSFFVCYFVLLSVIHLQGFVSPSRMGGDRFVCKCKV